VQLGEALKEGGGRRKKKNVDEARVCSCELDEAMVKGTECYPLSDEGSSSLVPESDQGNSRSCSPNLSKHSQIGSWASTTGEP
jgi:hypothetical protein